MINLTFDKKIKTLFLITIIFFVYALQHIFVLQILKHKEFEEQAKKQILKQYSVKGKRGKILTSTGEEIAYDVVKYNVILDPTNLSQREDLDDILNLASEYSKLSPKSLRNEVLRRSKKGSRYYNLKIFLNENQKDKLKENLIKIGAYTMELIYFEGHNKRVYAHEKGFRHIVGYLGYSKIEEDKLVGKYGVERIFEEQLIGKTEKVVKYVSANRKKELPIIKEDNKKTQKILDPDGNNVVLTIDYMMQYILNDEMEEFMKEYKPEWSTGIILNPQTGEILALASFPFTEKAYTRNAAIQNQYEPGSVMKPLIVAAALEEKLIDEEDIFSNPEGKIEKYSVTIRDSSSKTRGDLKPSDILIKSSNVGMVKIAEKIPDSIFEDYLKKYGFYEKTNVKLFGEINIRQTPRKKWDGLKKYSMSFGQAIAITPLQMAMGFASVINGGKLYYPMVFKQLETPSGEVIVKNEPEMVGRVISEETSTKLRTILEKVVNEGSGINAKIENYSIGGKTGTSQKSEKGKYSDDKSILSFAGFYPKDNPEYLCLIVCDEPKSELNYAGQIVAPLFKRITKRIFRYKNIPPDKGELIVLPTDDKMLNDEISFDLTTMPELKGLSAREVYKIFNEAGIEVKIKGTGNVVEQYPAYGVDMKKIKEIRVRLKE